jgi:hypothetical protein
VLLLLLPIAWLAVAIVVVAACQAAARGDQAQRVPELEPPHVVREGLLAWEAQGARLLRARHRARGRIWPERRRALRRLRRAAGLRRASHGARY